jgi:hypothetical protein
MILRLLAPLAILSTTATFAGGPGQVLMIPEANYIVDTRCSVLLATVRGVANHAATRAKPVDVDLQIDKILRGNLPKNVKCKWTWPYDPFFVFPDGPPRTPEMQQQAEAFAAEPVLPPMVGSKWVLLGDMIDLDSGSIFAPTYKYPLSKEKIEWALAEIERSKRLKAEREQYAGQWPETPGLPLYGLRKDLRLVKNGTPLKKGQPVILELGPSVGQLWQSRVIKVLKDGRVHVRPTGHDSRYDRMTTRDRLFLYPIKWLTAPTEIRSRHTPEQIAEFAALADLVVTGRVSSSSGMDRNSGLCTYTFQIDRLLKGSGTIQSVKLRVPLEISFLLQPRDETFILFLQQLDPSAESRLPNPITFEHISKGEGLVELDHNTLRAVQSGIAP